MLSQISVHFYQFKALSDVFEWKNEFLFILFTIEPTLFHFILSLTLNILFSIISVVEGPERQIDFFVLTVLFLISSKLFHQSKALSDELKVEGVNIYSNEPTSLDHFTLKGKEEYE